MLIWRVKRLVSKKIIMIGAGGHAGVLLDLLFRKNIEVHSLVIPVGSSARSKIFQNVEKIYGDNSLDAYDRSTIILVNGIGFLPRQLRRRDLFLEYSTKRFKFEKVVATTSMVSSNADLDEGVQIMDGCIIQSGARIGENTIVNTNASIDHDCDIGSHNHIAPGTTICGDVSTASNVFVGSGAVISNGVYIGENTIIGAGAIVTKDVESNKVVFGYRYK